MRLFHRGEQNNITHVVRDMTTFHVKTEDKKEPIRKMHWSIFKQSPNHR